jgi:hypothetical protein
MLVILKLSNGTEVAGDMVSEDKNTIILRYPLQVNFRYVTAGYPSVSFVKYAVFSEGDDIMFDWSFVHHVIHPRESFIQFYEYALDKYYFKLNQSIDQELSQYTVDSTMEEGEQLDDMQKKLLESIPVEHMTKN